MKKLIIFLGALFFTVLSFGQEFKASVTVSKTKVQNVDPKVFTSLEKDLNQFINSRKWTNDNFQNNEKIEVNFLLNITNANKDGNTFNAILTIQASRPVYNTDYNTPTMTHQDKEITFSYDQTQTLEFNENNVAGTNPLASNLTAIFAYYAYYILGLDYDSFSPGGGTQYFQKAQSIVDRAPDQGSSIRGWKSTGNKHNRYWMVEEILNAKFKEFPIYWYTYHRKGLDLQADDPNEGLKNVFSGIPILQKIYTENSNPAILQLFFDTKATELANMIRQAPQPERGQYASELMKIDVIHAKDYQNIK